MIRMKGGIAMVVVYENDCKTALDSFKGTKEECIKKIQSWLMYIEAGDTISVYED